MLQTFLVPLDGSLLAELLYNPNRDPRVASQLHNLLAKLEQAERDVEQQPVAAELQAKTLNE